MNDSDPTTDELHELFRPHREAVATHATEAELSAARSRSIAGQRGRVLGGTAAVALLAVGGGAIAVTSGDTSTPDIVRSAAIDTGEPTADTDAPAPEPTPDTTPVGTVAAEPTVSADEIDAWLASFPPPPSFDLDAFPVFDLGSGSGDFELPDELGTFIEEQRESVSSWTDDLAAWFDARPDGEIVIDFDRFLDAGTLDGLLDDGLLDLDPALGTELSRLDDIVVTIGDESIAVDVDGDGVPDEVIDLDELEDALTAIGEFDLSDLDIGDVDIEWDGTDLPDLSEFELPDGVDLPTQEEIDELLSDLETDLEQFDLEDFDLTDLEKLFDSNEFDQLFEDLLGG